MSRNREGDKANGIDALIRPTTTQEYIRTTAYLRPDQMELLDTLRAKHRRAGHRTTSASDLLRAAVDLAERYPDQWAAIATGTE